MMVYNCFNCWFKAVAETLILHTYIGFFHTDFVDFHCENHIVETDLVVQGNLDMITLSYCIF